MARNIHIKTPAERFWSRVDKNGPVKREELGQCWLWTGTKWGIHYGKVGYVDGRLWSSHRFSWLLSTGQDPGGMCVLHKCDTPLCVNPGHLFLGTQDDNMKDRRAKGRHRARYGAPTSDVVIARIREMRAAGTPLKQIAHDLGVSSGTASKYSKGLYPVVPRPVRRYRRAAVSVNF